MGKTNTITIYGGAEFTESFINKIGDGIRQACEKINIYSADAFGGTDSLAFRENLVREYNAKPIATCPDCGVYLQGIGPYDAFCPCCNRDFSFPELPSNPCYIFEEGVAEFIGKKIGNGYANHTGNHFHLGEVRGKTLYYATDPGKHFFSSHKGSDVSVILGSNKAEVPESWTGNAVYFSELFYVHDATGEIKISSNILHKILPKQRSEANSLNDKVVHERRSEWLMFISDLLSKPYNPDDFYRGSLRPKVACKWFRKKHPNAPKNEKEYQRDLRAFRHYDKNKPDRREEFIILLLRTAADKTITQKQRLGIAKTIPELVLYLNKNAEKNPGRPVAITRGAWQHCRDGNKEYIAVAEIDEFFIKLDKRLKDNAA